MDTQFHYNVAPKGRTTGYTTRIVFQDELTPAQIYTAAAARTGLTPAQVEAAAAAILTEVITAARSGRRTRRLGGLLNLTPRCGGAFTTEDFEPSVDNLNLAINATLTPEGDALLRENIHFHRDETVGLKTPHIVQVLDSTTRNANFCTLGGSFKITGHYFGNEPEEGDTTTGLFIQPIGGGAPIRINGYSSWTPKHITAAWPSTVPAQFQLAITTSFLSSPEPRTYIYPVSITQ